MHNISQLPFVNGKSPVHRDPGRTDI